MGKTWHLDALPPCTAGACKIPPTQKRLPDDPCEDINKLIEDRAVYLIDKYNEIAEFGYVEKYNPKTKKLTKRKAKKAIKRAKRQIEKELFGYSVILLPKKEDDDFDTFRMVTVKTIDGSTIRNFMIDQIEETPFGNLIGYYCMGCGAHCSILDKSLYFFPVAIAAYDGDEFVDCRSCGGNGVGIYEHDIDVEQTSARRTEKRNEAKAWKI